MKDILEDYSKIFHFESDRRRELGQNVTMCKQTVQEMSLRARVDDSDLSVSQSIRMKSHCVQSKMLRTKLKIIDELPSDFQKSVLPTNGDVIKAIYFKKYMANISFDAAKDKVTPVLLNIWNGIDIPSLTAQRVKVKMESLFKEYQKLLRINSETSTKCTEFLVFFGKISTIFYENIILHF